MFILKYWNKNKLGFKKNPHYLEIKHSRILRDWYNQVG